MIGGLAVIVFGIIIASFSEQNPYFGYGLLLIPLGVWILARGVLGWRRKFRVVSKIG